jgi:hypothetical protein
MEGTFGNPRGATGFCNLPGRRIDSEEAYPVLNLPPHPVVVRIVNAPGNVQADLAGHAGVSLDQVPSPSIGLEQLAVVNEVIRHEPVGKLPVNG